MLAVKNVRRHVIQKMLASRLNAIKPSPTLAISTKAKQMAAAGLDVVDFSLGEPDFNTPNNIVNAAKDAIDSGKTKYTQVDGIVELKQEIAKKYSSLHYSISNVSVNCGAKHTIFNAMMATINPGDEVIIPAPYWVSYVDVVCLLGGVPVIVDTDIKDEFKMLSSKLQDAISDRTKWLFLNSPSNPTGSMYTKEELRSIANVLAGYERVYVLSDDIYEHIVYDGKEFCNILDIYPGLKDRVLIVNGVSKGYAMTGWRIGYGVGNEKLISAMRTVQSQCTSNPCSISQYAALEALRGGSGGNTSTKEMLLQFQKRRDYIMSRLDDINGIEYAVPEGAFYVHWTPIKESNRK